MTRILVISDTHGNLTRLRDLVLNCPSIDYYLHLGDGQTPEELLNPFVTVRGNCDFAFMFRPSRTIKTPHGEIYMSHINTFSKDDFDFKSETIFLHGHTHVTGVKEKDNKVYINPGSVTIPKENTNRGYIILENNTFKFYDLDDNEILVYNL